MNTETRASIRRTYVDPFRDLRRTLAFLGIFLGIFGFSLINTFSAYDLASADYITLISYFAPAFLIAGFVYWPLLYMGFSAIDGLPWRVLIFLIQLASLIGFMYVPDGPLWRGLAGGIMMAPFWCVQHIAMVQNTTKENRGYEVSLSMLIPMFSGILAATMTGYLLETHSQAVAMILALSTMMIGTLCFLLSARIVRQTSARAFIQECRAVRQTNPYMARRIISQGIFEMPSIMIASLMYFMGVSPVMMATILVARLIVLFALSPIIGTLSHTHRKHGYSIGLIIMALAWLFLSVSPSGAVGLFFFAFMLFFGVGMRVADSSVITGLYEMQSYASMMWSELFWAIGRGIGLIFLIPILYYNATIYTLVLAGVTLFVFMLNKRWQRRWADAEAM